MLKSVDLPEAFSPTTTAISLVITRKLTPLILGAADRE